MSTISSDEAKKLTTVSEFKIVQASMDERAGNVSADRAKELIKLARELRDKAIGIAREQRREQRGKAEPRGKAPANQHERSKQKVQLFIETLARLKTKAAAIAVRDKEQAAAKTAQSKQPSKTSAAKQTAAPKSTTKSQSASTGKASKKPPIQPPLREIIAAPTKSVGVATLAKAGDRVQGKIKIGREKNRMALGGSKRIQGHTSGQTRRNQGKRDSKAAAARR